MLVKTVLFNIIWFTPSTTVLECMAELMGYNVDWFRLHDFISDSVSRNIFGIEKAYCFELRYCTSSSDMATDEVTLT